MFRVAFLKRAGALFAAALCLVTASMPLLAQPAAGPVLLTVDGDLWAWEGAGQPLTQLTDRGLNRGRVLSPDGTRAVYLSGADTFRTWLQTLQGAGGFVPPEDVWVLDLPSRQTFRIAGQPPDAMYSGPTTPGAYVMRQSLVWSPDGSALAWVEIAVDQSSFGAATHTNTVRLVVYDLVGRQASVIDEFPATGNSPQVGIDWQTVRWTQAGIQFQVWAAPARFRVYDTDGELIVEGTGDLFGQQAGAVEYTSTVVPNSAVMVDTGLDVTLTLPGQSTVSLGDVRPYGISRDGRAVVYGVWELAPDGSTFGYSVIIHDVDGRTVIGHFDNVEVVWGPTASRPQP
jgi:hypothetical protein